MPSGSLINSLRFFEAVARRGSLTGAAMELGVTPGAVSHHMRQLTEQMGETLFIRHGRGIALTETGQRLAQRLTVAFAEVANSVKDVVGTESPVVRLAVCSSFGPGFLIPRLASFYARYPDVGLKLMLYTKPPELSDMVGDALVSTAKDHPGFSSWLLIRETLVTVQAPDVPADRRGSNLLPLITTDIEDNRIGDDWQEYWAHTNQTGDNGRGWLMCSHYLFALEMAKQGLGIALVPDFLAARELQSGALVQHSPLRAPIGQSYYLCIKSSRAKERGLSCLRQWFAEDFPHADDRAPA